jgi:hypothetical protein
MLYILDCLLIKSLIYLKKNKPIFIRIFAITNFQLASIHRINQLLRSALECFTIFASFPDSTDSIFMRRPIGTHTISANIHVISPENQPNKHNSKPIPSITIIPN